MVATRKFSGHSVVMVGYTGLKYLNKLIENTWRIESNIFVISHTYDKNIYGTAQLKLDTRF